MRLLTLPKDSVGPTQLRADAVRTGKIDDGAVTSVKLSQGVRERIARAGAAPAVAPAVPFPESVKHAEAADRATTAGSADKAATAGSADTAATAETAKKADTAGSATTAASATTATSAGHADTADSATTSDDAEALGGLPANRYMTANSVLQSGQTEAGDFIVGSDNGSAAGALVQFWPHLPESVPENYTILVPEGGTTVQCPGAGQAAPRYMCIYQSYNEGMSFESFISTLPGSIYAGPVSGVMTWRSDRNNGLMRGFWAYTAE